jgi:hypothetical protein
VQTRIFGAFAVTSIALKLSQKAVPKIVIKIVHEMVDENYWPKIQQTKIAVSKI